MIVLGIIALLALVAFICLIIIYGIKKKSVIIWVIYSTVAFFLMTVGFATGLPSHNTSSPSTISNLKPLPIPFVPPEQTEKDYKDQAQPVNISDIAKQSSLYSEKSITFTGNVIGFVMDSNENAYWCNLSDSNINPPIVEVSLSMPDISKTQIGNTITIWGEGAGVLKSQTPSGVDITLPLIEMRYMKNLTNGYTGNFIKISYLPNNGVSKIISTKFIPDSEWGVNAPPGQETVGIWVNHGSQEHPNWQSQLVGVTRIDDLKKYDCTWSPIDNEITFNVAPPDLPNSIAIQYIIY